ncbi:MAG: DNA polymerase III subunit gamma/tau [Deltaproteobacteria bacterium]|nr:DNA polymerase III subunit gamma/tau [Deltaproteobacteria bacterium]
MTYLVFARKYRPLTFDEVVGQQHIVKTLKNSILNNRLHHAFIFSGPRGVGKTTTARILAKSLNCETGITISPCNRCSICIEITNGSSMDVQEIDAASHTGVDNIREIIDKVAYTPIKARYKVYIIDEAHMLSKAAFNALLKTLEEPPPHVKFIFATTEPNKIIPTITSRCQRFDFKRVENTDIITHLEEVLKKENIRYSKAALSIIARESHGSIRDALSILEHVISFSSGDVNEEAITTALGLISRTTIIKLFKCILNKEKEKAVEIIDESYMAGFDLQLLFNELIALTRNVLLLKIGQEKIIYNDLTSEDVEELRPLIGQYTTQGLHMLFDIFFNASDEIAKSEHPLFTAEIAILKAISVSSLKPIEEIIQRFENLEKRLLDKVATTSEQSNRVAEKEKADLDQPDIWLKIIEETKRRGKINLASILEDGVFIALDDNKMKIGFKGMVQLASVREKKNIDFIKQIINDITGKEVELVIQDLSIVDKVPFSISEEITKKKSESNRKETEEMIQHPLVQTAIQIFNAKIIEDKDKK